MHYLNRFKSVRIRSLMIMCTVVRDLRRLLYTRIASLHLLKRSSMDTMPLCLPMGRYGVFPYYLKFVIVINAFS